MTTGVKAAAIAAALGRSPGARSPTRRSGSRSAGPPRSTSARSPSETGCCETPPWCGAGGWGSWLGIRLRMGEYPHLSQDRGDPARSKRCERSHDRRSAGTLADLDDAGRIPRSPRSQRRKRGGTGGVSLRSRSCRLGVVDRHLAQSRRSTAPRWPRPPQRSPGRMRPCLPVRRPGHHPWRDVARISTKPKRPPTALTAESSDAFTNGSVPMSSRSSVIFPTSYSSWSRPDCGSARRSPSSGRCRPG